MTITVYDKLECVQRELRIRRDVYARRVRDNKMSQEAADREIALMKAIVDDYERSAKVVQQPSLL